MSRGGLARGYAKKNPQRGNAEGSMPPLFQHAGHPDAPSPSNVQRICAFDNIRKPVQPTRKLNVPSIKSVNHPPERAASLLTERDVASELRLSPAMLRKLRREGSGPTFIRIGSAIRYPAADLAAWVGDLRR